MKICLISVAQSILPDCIEQEIMATFLEEKGHIVDVKNFVFQDVEAEIKKCETWKYDCAGLIYSNVFYNIDLTARLGQAIKKNTRLVFLHGNLASLSAKSVLCDYDFIDFILLGEGEYVITEILSQYEANNRLSNHENILTHDNTVNGEEKVAAILDEKHLISAHRKYLELPEFRGELIAQMYTSRGCFGNCSFCPRNLRNQAGINSPCWRGRDIYKVFNEMVEVNKKYGIRIFLIEDFSFGDPKNVGKERISLLCDLMLANEVKFALLCFTRAEIFHEEDIELLQKMKKACFSVYLGIESMDKNDLDVYRKISSPEDNLAAVNLFKKVGIEVNIGFIMLNAHSTLESIKKNYLFLANHYFGYTRLYESKIFAYEGTKIQKDLAADSMLLDDYSYSRNDRYKFYCSEVDEIAKAIEYQQSVCDFYEREEDFEFYYNIYRIALELYDEDFDLKQTMFGQLKDELYRVEREHFKLLYYDYNVEQFKEDIPSYIEKVHGILDRYENIKTKLFMQKGIRQLVTERSKKAKQFVKMV